MRFSSEGIKMYTGVRSCAPGWGLLSSFEDQIQQHYIEAKLVPLSKHF